MPTSLQNSDAKPLVCKYLRTKALHVYGHQSADLYQTSRSSHYYCQKTQFVTGPDQGLCTPEACQPHRQCFLSRDL